MPSRFYPLGLNISPEEKRRNQVAHLAANQLLCAIPFRYPGQWNWRNVQGLNWLSPMRDQQDCGACVPFAICAAAEARAKIDAKDSTKDFDLSEQFLFSKGGGSCQNGSQFERVLGALVNPGTPDEACCPYLQNKTCPDYAQRLTRAASYTTLKTVAQAKEWIATQGPVVGGMEVSSDFFNVDSNAIYSPTTGDFVGNHAICIIGYDEINKCWIMRNSWGLIWGDQGYGRIKYNTCGIGSSFPFYGITLSSSPVPPQPEPVPNHLGTDDIKITRTGTMYLKLTSLKVAYPLQLSLYKPEVRDIGTVARVETGIVLNVGKVTKGDIIGFKIVTGEPVPRTLYTDGLLNPAKYRNLFTMPWGVAKWHILGELAGRADHGEMTLEVTVQ